MWPIRWAAAIRSGLKLVVKQNLTGYDERGLPVMDNNMVYRIDQINVFPNYDPTVARTDSTFLQRLDTLYYRGLNMSTRNAPTCDPRSCGRRCRSTRTMSTIRHR